MVLRGGGGADKGRYSRINGAGAFVTTYGPGELSAYCGHAGAYAEFCKVVHIVGYPGESNSGRRRAKS